MWHKNPPLGVEGAGRWDDPWVGSSDLTYHARERSNTGQSESTLYFLYLFAPALPRWWVLLWSRRRIAARNGKRRDLFPGGKAPSFANPGQELVHRTFTSVQLRGQ